MAQRNYISLSKLSTFLDNLKNTFAHKTHTHTISEITDISDMGGHTVDTELSSTSNNPVANSTINAEFEAISDAMGALEMVIDEKVDANHNHDDKYYTESEIDSLLSNKADSSHNHNESYDAKGSASAVQENLNIVSDELDVHTGDTNIHVTTTNKTNWNAAHTHSQSAHARTDATKVADSTTNGNILIDGTETNVYSHPNSGVTAGTYKSVTVNAQGHITAGTNPTTLAGYGITDAESKGAASSALASAKEYTDTVANGKSDKTHNHDNAYDAKGSASSALASAKTYADSAASSAANAVKNDLLNGAGAAYDTLKELGDLIVDNADAIDALEVVAAGKADKTHGHAIADVSGLQSALDGKAAASHGTHVSYSTTAPVMDGTASAGSAGTVARSDHKHPTDTSRAAKTDLDSHTGNTTVHITSTERSNWNAAKTHADSAHAPSNAEKNQNAFSNITVGSTTVAADTATDTVTFVGSNVTITPDATNDKITFAVADGSTSAKGIVQLTNSTSSTSTTTAATPNSVKSAYDRASTAITNAATAQTRADSAYTLAEGKANSSHTHDDRYYTESEVNTKLNAKLDKLTYEWNKELALGGTGYVCIGKFPMYDSNITVEIRSTTNTTYNGTLIIATQNINTAGGGSYAATVYGDATNSLTDSIKIHYGSGSNVFSVYINLPGWSKNILHIRGVALAGTPTNIAETVSSIPSNATIVPTNALKAQLDTKASSSHTHTPSAIGAAAASHTHDDRYYTEAEIDTKVSTLNTAINGKAASSHTHSISNVTSLQSSLDAKVPTSRTVNGKALSSNISLSASDVGAAASSHTHDYLPLSGGSLYNAATIKLTQYGTRDLTIDGNSLTFDLSKDAGGWAISLANLYDATKTNTTMLGAFGGTSGVNWIYMGGSYDNPHFKITPDGVSYFKNTPYVGSTAVSLNGHTHDDRYYTETEIDTKLSGKASTSAATQSAAGLMSAADKEKLDGVATGANKITVDTAMSSSSTNPVQNKVVQAALNGKAPAYQYSTTDLTAGTSSLATGTLYFVYE